MSTIDVLRPRSAGVLPAILIALGVTLLLCLPSADGHLSLAGLLLAVVTAVLTVVGLWIAVPTAIVALVPTLIPAPMMFLTFAWELLLLVLAVAMLVHGLRRRETWLWRLGPLELALLAFSAWALFSYFWSPDLRFYLIGSRRMLLGLVALWVATRLPYIASRRWFEWGIIGGASSLALAALFRALSSGLTAQQAMLHRPEVTHLGWGTANYIATMLLLFTPSLLWLGLRGRNTDRLFAWIAFALATAVQLLVASRAASALFIGATLVQVLMASPRSRAWVGFGTAGAITALLLSPLGSGLLWRFVSLREMGSLTIRIWYFRESWRRLVESMPWGLGLSQGYSNADRLKGIDPHNYWLLVGGDHGAIGVILWVIVLGVIVRGLLALRRNAADRGFASTMLLTFVVANLHTLVEPTFQGTQFTFLWFWLFGGALAYGAVAAREATSASPAR
jgi:hypothetical protein